MTKDMTQGLPIRLIIGFSVPLFFGSLFQQLYHVVDTMIVGRFLGKEALAAVGLTSYVTYMIIGFCVGLCSGFAIPVSQQFGAKNFHSLRRYVGNTVWLTAAAAVVFTVITVVLCRPVLQWIQTPGNIIEQSYSYLVVIFAGIPVSFLYNIQAALLRALGDSRTPLIFLLISSFLNIAFDLLFVVSFAMGVQGAAIATVLSQLISGLLCFIFIVRKFPILHISREDLTFDKTYVKTLCEMGIPMGLQTSITAIGGVLLQSSINDLGSEMIAAVTASDRLHSPFACAFDAMGIAMSTYSGQNIGAKRIDRLSPGLHAGMLIGGIYSAIAFAIMLFFGRQMLVLFVDPSETQVLDNAYVHLLITSVFFITQAIVNIFRLFIQGMGYSKMAIFSGVFEMIARSLTGLFLVPAFGFLAACFASPIAWVLADTFLIFTYFRITGSLKKKISA